MLKRALNPAGSCLITCIGLLVLAVPLLSWLAPVTNFFGAEIIRSVGGAVFSTGLILTFLQTRLVASDIEKYFVAAFTDSSYVARLEPTKRHEIVSCALSAQHPLREKKEIEEHVRLLHHAGEVFLGRPGDFVKNLLHLVGTLDCTYIQKSDNNYTIRGDDAWIYKTISRETVYCFKELKPQSLFDFVRSVARSRACFESVCAQRVFTSLQVRVGDVTLLEQQGAPLSRTENLAAYMPVTTVLDWDNLPPGHKQKMQARLLVPGELVTIVLEESRQTGWSGAMISRTFNHLVMNLTVDARVEDLTKKKRLRGQLFGWNVNKTDYTRVRNQRQFFMSYNKWLLPGEGFTVFLDDED